MFKKWIWKGLQNCLFWAVSHPSWWVINQSLIFDKCLLWHSEPGHLFWSFFYPLQKIWSLTCSTDVPSCDYDLLPWFPSWISYHHHRHHNHHQQQHRSQHHYLAVLMPTAILSSYFGCPIRSTEYGNGRNNRCSTRYKPALIIVVKRYGFDIFLLHLHRNNIASHH